MFKVILKVIIIEVMLALIDIAGYMVLGVVLIPTQYFMFSALIVLSLTKIVKKIFKKESNV